MRPFRDLSFDQLAVGVVVTFSRHGREQSEDSRHLAERQSLTLEFTPLKCTKRTKRSNPTARFAPSFDPIRLDQAKGGRHVPAPRRLSQPFTISGGANLPKRDSERVQQAACVKRRDLERQLYVGSGHWPCAQRLGGPRC